MKKQQTDIDRQLSVIYQERIRQMSTDQMMLVLLFPEKWDETYVDCVKSKILTQIR